MHTDIAIAICVYPVFYLCESVLKIDFSLDEAKKYCIIGTLIKYPQSYPICA
jgi:hypothetical protein